MPVENRKPLKKRLAVVRFRCASVLILFFDFEPERQPARRRRVREGISIASCFVLLVQRAEASTSTDRVFCRSPTDILCRLPKPHVASDSSTVHNALAPFHAHPYAFRQVRPLGICSTCSGRTRDFFDLVRCEAKRYPLDAWYVVMSSSIRYHGSCSFEKDLARSKIRLRSFCKLSGELPIGSLVELPLKLMIFYPVFHCLSFASFTEAVL